ncbi:GNAT family N-acetyltransferase [Bosea sp. RAF48]|uniref:GNAT family N-acetyltransferase n=1 Tax=Bosea sp. RAF48 TaxID=3237480 RepID=UPI003F916A10
MSEFIALAGMGGTASMVPAGRRSHPGTAVHCEIRPLASCDGIAAEWADLAARAIEPNPFLDPGFALTAAQHLVSFRDVALMLLWQGEAERQPRRLIGLVPFRRRQRLFAAEALDEFADPRLFNGTPLIDSTFMAPALSALLRAWRREAGPTAGLTFPAVDPAGPFAAALIRIARRHGFVADWQGLGMPGPQLADMAVVAEARTALEAQGTLRLEKPSTLADRRDAVEMLLALEASGRRGQTGRATLQDIREAAFLRSMTRSLSRQKLCRIALLMLDERPIAAALTLGRAPTNWLYLAAGDDSLAPAEPLALLLAMMNKAAPARQIRLAGGLRIFGAESDGFGTLRLSHRRAGTPADLAARIQRRIGQSLFRTRSDQPATQADR